VSLIAGTFRGVRRRAGVSLGILLVATVAAAAAATGPAYDAAARASILQDNLHDQPVADRTVTVTEGGLVVGLADTLNSEVNTVLATQLGGQPTASRLFRSAVQAVSVTVTTVQGQSMPLTWRTGECAHLRLVAGSCPTALGQVLVGTSAATNFHFRPGQRIPSSGYGHLTVTGVYAIPGSQQLNTAYWVNAACDDFAYEDCFANSAPASANSNSWDAMFTPAATFLDQDLALQGQALVVDEVAADGVRPADVGTLSSAVTELLTDPSLEGANASMGSNIPQLVSQITAAWQTLDVPVFLITVQVLLLAWLLLFLIATDAAEARAGEVALAKLRGHGRLRTLAFGLSEPVLLLVAGFPVGALAGWAATGELTHFLLRPGTRAGLPVLAVAAAAAATLGGLVAITIAARRALVRPVTEQWRHTGSGGLKRGWVLDSVLLTGALAGLAELVIGGNVTSTKAGSLALIVPGLLGVAAAVITSRLLPAACGLAFPFTRRHGGTGLFLAVRHIARRPGGTRTTIVLTAAFALATFAVAAFAVDQRNVDRVAIAQTGASAVLTVTPPPGQDLGAIVDRIDPGGTKAAAVDRYAGGTSSGTVLLAVEPQRFARVAQWPSGVLDRSPASIGTALDPPAPPPVTLPAGSQAVRVQVSGQTGTGKGANLSVWLVAEGAEGGGQQQVSLGALHNGLLSAAVAQCPCRVVMVSIDSATGSPGGMNGSVTLSGLAAQTADGTWTPVSGALSSADGWQAGAEDAAGCAGTKGQVQAGAGGALTWTFSSAAACSPGLSRQDTPSPLPALVASQVTSSQAPMGTVGLDGRQIMVRPVVLAGAIPDAPATGIVVDRTYAQQAASDVLDSFVSEQVWVAPGALTAIRAKLVRAGVTIGDVTTTASTQAALLRQGPALASVLFLAAAVAAALLATGAAILGLYQAGRRRRYEYAALTAGRVPRRALTLSVLIEQATVLGFGAVTGIGAGIAAAALVLRNVPVFITPPAAPALVFTPPLAQILVWLAGTAVLLAIPVTMATLALIRSARPELLREAAP